MINGKKLTILSRLMAINLTDKHIVFYIAATTVFKRNFTRPDHPDGEHNSFKPREQNLQEPGGFRELQGEDA